MKLKILLFAITCGLWVNSLQAQTVLKGRVADRSNQEPLVSALVMSSMDTTITDKQGKFTITTPNEGGTLEVQYLGYHSFSMNIINKVGNIEIGLSPSTLALNEVVINATSHSNALKNTSSGISIVSKEMIQRDDPFTAVNALNRVPGVYMHSGTYNTNRLTIRGIGSRSLFGTNKIKAYYGQIPLTDGSGNSIIEDIDQGLIERIEVYKGPNSSLFGAGLAGVVSISPYQPPTQETSLEGQWSVGEFNTLRYMGRFNHSDDRNSLAITYATTESAGYRNNSRYKRDQVGLSWSYTLNETSYISIFGFYTSLISYIPSAITFYDYTNNPRKAAPTWAGAQGYEQYDKSLFGASYHKDFSDQWSLDASLFTSHRDAYEPRPFNILEEETASVGTRTLVGYTSGSFHWSTGMEVFFDKYKWGTIQNLYGPTTNGSVEGNRLTAFTENRNYFNIFTEFGKQFPNRLTVTAGANLNSTKYRLQDTFQTSTTDVSGDYSFDPVLSPRLGMSYPMSKSTTVFTNISHGFSPPSLDETLYPNGQINPNIRPESGWNFETGIRGNHKSLNYDVTMYFMRISDLLVAQRTTDDAFTGVNAGLNHHAGLDLSLNYYIEPIAKHQLNFFTTLALTHYKFVDFVNEDMDHSGNWLTGMPRVMFNPGVEWLSPKGIYGNLTGQIVGKIPIYDANTLYADQYFVLRGKVGYRASYGRFTFDGHVGANNITDSKYASMLLINATAFGTAQPRIYYPGLPRHFYGGILVKYVFGGK